MAYIAQGLIRHNANNPRPPPLLERAHRLALRRTADTLLAHTLPTCPPPLASVTQSADSPLVPPVITDGALILAESDVIVEYIIYKHGDGRLTLSPSHPDYADYLYWFHFSNVSMQATIGRNMMIRRCIATHRSPSR